MRKTISLVMSLLCSWSVMQAMPVSINAFETTEVTETDTPSLDVDIKNLEINCIEGQEGRASFMIIGQNLDPNSYATITLNDETGLFRLGRTQVLGVYLAEGGVVNVYFNPVVAGTYTASATVNFPGCDPVLVNIKGTAALLKETPVMNPASDVHATSFRATWTPVANVESYTLYVDSKSEGATLLLEEDFSDFTSTISTYDALNQMDNAGWTGKYVYGENGALRINDRAYYPGWITSPNLNLSDSGGKVTVTLSAKSYSTYDKNVKLIIKTDSDSKEIDLTDEVQDFTVTVGCTAAADQQVTIEGRNANQKRALLYNLAIYSGELTTANGPARANEQGDATKRVITGITDNTYVVNGLTANGTFNFKVEANYIDGTVSPTSNIETVTLAEGDAMRGDVNGDSVVDIDDVNAVISIILGKSQPDDYPGEPNVNSDNAIDIDDVNEIIKIILGK